MNARRLVIGSLVLFACSRSPQDAGIVLNVDTNVTADRTAINHLIVTVDGKRQEWTLTRPLPGSVGLKTSPGTKSVVVDGLHDAALLGTWSGSVVANKGAVVVQDVHLACVGCARDAGPDAADSGQVTDTRDASSDSLDASSDSLDARSDSLDARSDSLDARSDSLDASSLDLGLPDGNRAEALDTGSGDSAGRDGSADVANDGRDGAVGADAALDRADVPASGDVAGTDALPGMDGPTAPLTGAFSVASQFEIPATAAAPGPLGDTLKLVHGLVQDPGGAILDFAEDAGVPGLSTLRSALPDALESRLTGWMNAYIKTASVGGVTPYDQLVSLDGIIQSLLLRWGLRSRLYVPLDALGTHSPVSLSFAASLSPVVVPLEPTAPVTSGTGVTVTLSWPNGLSGAAVATISDHSMGLPFGRYALQGLNAILLAEFGTPNLTAFLSNAIGCAGMAKYVASQCVDVVLTNICVGYESELLSICEGGLAEGAKQIEDQIRGLDFKAIHFLAGRATAVGASLARPQDATALTNGVWTATVDLGSGAEPATATFAATTEVPAP